MAKESFIVYYQVVAERGHDNILDRCISYYFTSHKDAKAFYREMKLESKESSSNIISIKFICFIHYFDNCGRLAVGHGSTKKEAYETLYKILNK